MLIGAIRGWELSQLDKGISILESVISSISEEDMRQYRDGEDGWIVLEVLCHLRDLEQILRISQ